MANGQGDARAGAGRKKKLLTEKLLEGNPGKRKITVLDFVEPADLQGAEMPPTRDHLSAMQKSGNPPYGRPLSQWMQKAKSKWHGCRVIVCLAPARTDAKAP